MKENKVLQSYLPMTETAFYILLSLVQPRHGYRIMKHIEKISKGRLTLGSGTVYGTLRKMNKDGIIAIFSDEERRTVYEITEKGKKLLRLETDRLAELYRNAEYYKGGFRD